MNSQWRWGCLTSVRHKWGFRIGVKLDGERVKTGESINFATKSQIMAHSFRDTEVHFAVYISIERENPLERKTQFLQNLGRAIYIETEPICWSITVPAGQSAYIYRVVGRIGRKPTYVDHDAMIDFRILVRNDRKAKGKERLL